MDEPYLNGTYRWWHLSEPSPELLVAETSLVAGKPGVAVDLGCGLGTEIGYLAGRGWRGLGVDLSVAALAQARTRRRTSEAVMRGRPAACCGRAAGCCCGCA